MRKPNLEDVVAHGSDYPVPQVAVPDHHDRRRPLTVCLWDAPNMDAPLFSVTGADHHTIVRPQYDVLSRWLVNQRPPSPSKMNLARPTMSRRCCSFRWCPLVPPRSPRS